MVLTGWVSHTLPSQVFPRPGTPKPFISNSELAVHSLGLGPPTVPAPFSLPQWVFLGAPGAVALQDCSRTAV